MLEENRVAYLNGLVFDLTCVCQSAFKVILFTFCDCTLDVFDDEPLSSDSPLWSMENALIAPHISFAGDGNSKRLADLIMRNLKGVAND